MNEKQKNTLYLVGIITLVIIAILCIVWTVKVPTIPFQSIESKKITVSAEGKVSIKPDVAIINAGVEVKAKTAEEAQKQSDVKMNGLIAYLKSQGIDEKNLKTSNYSLYPEYFYPQNEKPVIVGFISRQDVEIKIVDLKKTSLTVGNLTNKGVNIINSISFQIDEPGKYQAEARADAIKKARVEAEKIANNLGVKLGKVVDYNEGVAGSQPYYKEMSGMGGGGASPIESGSQDIRVSVNIAFEIK